MGKHSADGNPAKKVLQARFTAWSEDAAHAFVNEYADALSDGRVSPEEVMELFDEFLSQDPHIIRRAIQNEVYAMARQPLDDDSPPPFFPSDFRDVNEATRDDLPPEEGRDNDN